MVTRSCNPLPQRVQRSSAALRPSYNPHYAALRRLGVFRRGQAFHRQRRSRCPYSPGRWPSASGKLVEAAEDPSHHYSGCLPAERAMINKRNQSQAEKHWAEEEKHQAANQASITQAIFEFLRDDVGQADLYKQASGNLNPIGI
jgi:hypothetical protein